jgi:hypothetical protein
MLETKADLRSLLNERNARAVFSSNAVGESAEVVARQIVLEISRIEMIG